MSKQESEDGIDPRDYSDYCPNAKDNKHIPDWNSITTDSKRDFVYIDVNCSECGSSGCLAMIPMKASEIDW